MPRRPATVTQADIARVIRAAKQAGAAAVEVRPDGTVVIVTDPARKPEANIQLDRRADVRF